MKISRPSYYDAFRCLAGACPDSCCQEWEVQVDDASAGRYFSLSGDLGDALREKLKQDDSGTYYMEVTEGRCPMWEHDGLCRIQRQLGEAALCDVCREFPRLRHDYGDFVELGLELSCPEAARLILACDHGEDVVQEVSGGEAPDYDTEAMGILLDTRRKALAILEQGSPAQALTKLLLYGCRVQEELDGGEPAETACDGDTELVRTLAGMGQGIALRTMYRELEILTQRWQARLDNPASTEGWPEELRAMARYGVQRYWLQAVSDYDLAPRVKMIVAGCLLVRELGGEFAETAQLYAKEIENSAENVDALLDGAYTHPALTDANLLWHLVR